MIKRIHNSNTNSLIFKDTKQSKDYLNSNMKPQGLWYGINNAWLEWCEGEMPHWIYKYNYELQLDLSKILIITNKGQLLKFSDKYFDKTDILTCIDWEKIVKEYSGIEMNPYLYSMRFNMDMRGCWYSIWGCSSGCIWNKDALLSIKKENKNDNRTKNSFRTS